jgi:hypothetical protein
MTADEFAKLPFTMIPFLPLPPPPDNLRIDKSSARISLRERSIGRAQARGVSRTTLKFCELRTTRKPGTHHQLA